MNTDDTDRQGWDLCAKSPEARRLLLPEGQREAHFSSAESGVKHAHQLKTLHILRGTACLTPDSAEEKAKAGAPLASLHTESTLVDPCHLCSSVSKEHLADLM